MAILIDRNNTEKNQHKNENGLEWSRIEQNRLARSLEAGQARANLRNEIGVFQVERGDTLGAIAKGLTSTINWGQRVDYRSSKLSSAAKPNVLGEADLIYPGQYVWVENGTLIVADVLPATTITTVAPIRPSTPSPVIIPPAPTGGNPPVVRPQIPPTGPAAVPRLTNWVPTITTPQTTPFNELPNSMQRALEAYLPRVSAIPFETSSVEVDAMPSNINAFLDIARTSVTLPREIPFLISRDYDPGSQGGFFSDGSGYTYTSDFSGTTTAISASAASTAVVINMSGGPRSLNSSRTDTPEFAETLLNEFSHAVTSDLVDEFLKRRVPSLIGTQGNALPDSDVLIQELTASFTHPDIPSGMYNFTSYNELQSDAFSMSLYPESIQHRYLIYGITPINPAGYDLNRDFTAHHLAEFLSINGYGTHQMRDINQVFRRLHNANNIGNGSEVQNLIDTYHLNDPAFFAYMQPKYQAVGEAFYGHVTSHINSL